MRDFPPTTRGDVKCELKKTTETCLLSPTAASKTLVVITAAWNAAVGGEWRRWR